MTFTVTPRPVRAAAPPIAAAWAGTIIRAIAVSTAGLLSGMVIWSILPALVGWTPTVVVSGSMSPKILPGDVVVSGPAPISAIHPGMVVLAHNPAQPGHLLMHRVMKFNDDGTLRTKGDANGASDSTEMPRANIVAIARLRIPWIGLPMLWMRHHQYGPLAILAIALSLMAAALTGSAPAGRHRTESSGGPAANAFRVTATTLGFVDYDFDGLPEHADHDPDHDPYADHEEAVSSLV
jgi:signal peptidase